MGDREESEEEDSSLSLHEDISFSAISSERLQLGDEVAIRGDWWVSTTGLASGEYIQW